jgi:2-oxoisovalerate dehydrogenase E1 component
MNTFCLCTEIWEYLLEDIPLYRLFSQCGGKLMVLQKVGIVVFILNPTIQNYWYDFVGPQLGVADGIALAINSRKRKVTAVFTGEGATSEGDFHEALNIASVWELPVLCN